MKASQIKLAKLFSLLMCCFSVQVVAAQEPEPHEVILYEAQDYIGDSESFKLPADLPYWGTPVGNTLYGKVSSIRIGSEVGVFLFKHADFTHMMNADNRHCENNYQDLSHNYLDPYFHWEKGLHFFKLSENSRLLECNDFYNGLIIYRKEGFEGLVGARVSDDEGYNRYLFLYPPQISSSCISLQDDKYFDVLAIIRHQLKYNLKTILFRQNSCAGKGVAFPGPGSNKKHFLLEDYTFSENDHPQSILITYEGPYNQYGSKIQVKETVSKEPQWIEPDTDRPGNNFRNFWMQQASSVVCRNACAEDARCKAYTYVPPGLSGDPNRARCWLKNSVPDPVSRVGMVSGAKIVYEQAKKMPGGSPAGPTTLLPKAGVGTTVVADAIRGFRLVESNGDRLVFEVDYSVEASHGSTVFLGGWIYDNQGQGVSGYKPVAVAVPGLNKAKLEVTLDSGTGHLGKEIEFFLYEPSKSPFVNKRFPLNMRLPSTSTQSPKVKMAPGYVTAQDSAPVVQQVDLSGTWSSNIGLEYQVSQNGNKISYQDPLMNKPVNGTISGNTVTVSWSEGEAVRSLEGTVTQKENSGRATRIEWGNSVVFHR